MSGGPIKQWRDAWLPPKVSTDPKTAVHLAIIGENERRYCGHRRGEWTTNPALVTCANCLAALTADGVPA